jgi:hypothetical protein
MKNAYKILVEYERKRPFGRHRRKWGDDIKMGLNEVVCDSVALIHLAQDRV